jgi:zinc transporter
LSRAFLYREAKAAELPFAEGAAHFGECELLWLHLDGREADARDWLEAQQTIPDIARSALLAVETRPRCELMGHGALINLRGLGSTPEDDPDALVSIRFWVERGRAISVGMRSNLALEPVIDRFLGGVIEDTGDLISVFADVITEALDPEIADLGDQLDAIEVNLETKGVFAMRRKVSALRSQAIAYRRFVVPQRQALETLATARLHWLDHDDQLHLREAADRFARMAEELEAVRERAAIVHDELTDLHAEAMDGRSLAISIYALVFLPLTFITGLLGMNVPIPYSDRPDVFWWILGLCALIALAGFVWFVRRRWIRRDGTVE